MSNQLPRQNDGGAHSLGDVIDRLLDTYKIKSKFDEANIIVSWERMVGKLAAKHTKRIYINKRVLFVELDSPSLKNELTYSKKEVLQLFVSEFGPNLITDIVML